MMSYTRQWCLVVSLMTLSLVISMPTSGSSLPPAASSTSRYQSTEGTLLNISNVSIINTDTTLIYMQALGKFANYTRNEELLATNNNARSVRKGLHSLRDTKKEDNFIKIAVIKENTKGSQTQPVRIRHPESSTKKNLIKDRTKVKISPNLKIDRKNATVTYHRGTVGGGIRLTVTTPRPKTHQTQTTIKKIISVNNKRIKTKNSNKTNELKQSDFVLLHVPSPDPMPEVTSYSPQYTFEKPPQSSPDLNDNIVPLSSVETSSNGYPIQDESSDLGDIVDIPLGTVDLDLVPEGQSGQGQFYSANTAAANPCPSYHLTSNVFAPQSKEAECPDLNVVLNSHYHPAYDTRKPETSAAESAVPAASAPLAEPATGAVPAAAPAAPAGGGGFPPLGVPQLPEFPGLPNISLPDLKGLMDIVGALWNVFRSVFRYIWPVLVAIPIIVFAKTLVATFIAIFPWWFPALFLVASKSDYKEKEHYHYKHVHKPVVHPNGWFWNHETKTWTNILDSTKLSGGHHPYKGHSSFRIKYK